MMHSRPIETDLADGNYVAILQTDRKLVSKNFKSLYKVVLFELRDSCNYYHRSVGGHSSYSAKIFCPSGAKFEITVYDFAFYKGLAIERKNKTYYCSEKMR